VGASRDAHVDFRIWKMELTSQKFCEAVREALSSGKFVVATIMRHGIRFADEIKARLDGEIIEITLQNRDEVPKRITED
jgi:nucleoside-triphosphatase THEP1